MCDGRLAFRKGGRYSIQDAGMYGAAMLPYLGLGQRQEGHEDEGDAQKSQKERIALENGPLPGQDEDVWRSRENLPADGRCDEDL